ncbi:hypothetical protein [Clostridium sp. Marseille-Q7071]
MKNTKKGIVITICLLSLIGVYKYIDFNREDIFKIRDVDWKAETTLWTDNSKNNMYNIKFKVFDGTDTKEIITDKSAYDMKINTDVDKGELIIKIYNDKKILFEKSGLIDETIKISNEDNKNVKVEAIGKKAKGNIKYIDIFNII